VTREEKNKCIDDLATQLASNDTIYLADVSELNADQSRKLRRLCFNKQVSLKVVKNTLLKKAIEKVEDKDLSEFNDILVGNTSLLFSEAGSAPAKLIKEFRRKSDKPILKGAYIEESIYLGDEQLDVLANLKTKNELVADVILLLQSPITNVISALQSGGNKLTGLLKTLSEKTELDGENNVESEVVVTPEQADESTSSAKETSFDISSSNEDELKSTEDEEDVNSENEEAEENEEKVQQDQEPDKNDNE